MKIIFFGLGSIGQRHARLLLKNFKHTLFAYRSSKTNQPNRLGIKELDSWKEIKQASPDVAFITNPTFLHIKTGIKCAELGINLFIEKPIDCSTNRLDELIDLVKKKNLTAYVAYCMRFHPAIRMIRRYLVNRSPLHCRVVASSYLPDWQPSRNYRNIYSAQGNKGGGVIFDLSHEIDYCWHLFGDILEIEGIYGKISSLKVDCEDYADILMKCKKGIVNLHLNFFSKNTERKIEIDFKNSDFIKADLIANSLLINKNGVTRKYNFNLKRNGIYLGQLKYFFKNFKNKKMMNNLIDAAKLFKTIIAFKNKNEK